MLSTGRPARQCICSAAGSQVHRFRQQFSPEGRGQPFGNRLGWPLQQDPVSSQRAGIILEDTRVLPEQLWDTPGPVGSVNLSSKHAQHCRVSQAPVPVSVSLPGSQHWLVEVLADISKRHPSLQFENGKLRFVPGRLAASVDDPKAVSFCYYQGLEQAQYSWGERAVQALFTVAYAGVHLAIFNWIWSSSPLLAVAFGLNWAIGGLSLGKCAVLLFLASQERLWLYFAYLVGKVIDRGLAKLLPPVRKLFMAMFTVWALFVLLSPAHYYPLPFTPFAPGTLGANEAFA